MGFPAHAFRPAASTIIPVTLKVPELTQAPNRLALFSEDWITLQRLIGLALQAPIDIANFDTKYGGGFSASHQERIRRVTDGMSKVVGAAGTFGDPTKLRTLLGQNSTFLSDGTQAPPELYSHMVWLAHRLLQTSAGFQLDLAELKQALDPAMVPNKEERRAAMRALLIGSDDSSGMVRAAERMEAQVQTLITRLDAFRSTMTEATLAFDSYKADRVAILADAKKLLQEAQRSLAHEQSLADHAKTMNNTFGILAIAVGLLGIGIVGLLSCGVGVAFLTGLGVSALKVGVTVGVVSGLTWGGSVAAQYYYLKQWEHSQEEIKKWRTIEAQRKLLISDLTAFDSNVMAVDAPLRGLVATLGAMRTDWRTIKLNLQNIAGSSADQMKDWSSSEQITQMDEACSQWRSIETAARHYTLHALMDFRTVTQSNPIPAEAASVAAPGGTP